jgi:hypothetical protein
VKVLPFAERPHDAMGSVKGGGGWKEGGSGSRMKHKQTWKNVSSAPKKFHCPSIFV